MRSLPALSAYPPLQIPEHVEQTLSSGLTVIAIRRPGVPLVQLRLEVPFALAGLAQGTVLAHTLFAGTGTRTNVDIAAELSEVGGALRARSGPDRLKISGDALGTGLDRLLELLAEVLRDAAYPEHEVHTQRDRLAARLKVNLNQPSHLVRMALRERVYGDHPYRVQTPSAEEVSAVEPGCLRTLHARRLRPGGATLVLVGDFDPAAAIGQASLRLGGWQGTGCGIELPPIPPLTPGPLLVVDRPGAAQSSLRLALPAVGRDHPDYAPLWLANLIFGGYFSSRWTENLREDKGYAYGPSSRIHHSAAGSTLLGSADVATSVTAAALVETLYELGRITCLPPGRDEVDQARQYALGATLVTMSTQTGLAKLASHLAGCGLRLDDLIAHSDRIASVDAGEIHAAAVTYLAPARAVTVILGDADQMAAGVAAVTPLEIRRSAKSAEFI